MAKDIIGIIVGAGALPEKAIAHLQEIEQEFVLAIIDSRFSTNKFANLDYQFFSIGKVGGIISYFKKKKVNKIIMLGKVAKPKFSELKLDLTGIKLLAQISRNKIAGDNALLTSVISFIESKGFSVIGVKDLKLPLFFSQGFYGKVKNKKKLLQDFELAQNLMKSLSSYDVGQSLTLQEGRVIGIEAAEGTDKLIKRSKEYIDTKSDNPAFLYKSSKLGQDLRVDLPTIGFSTIENLFNNGFSGLVIESDNTIFLDKEKIISFLEGKEFFIYAY